MRLAALWQSRNDPKVLFLAILELLGRCSPFVFCFELDKHVPAL